jgi:D-amino-acid dehydrogenase
MKKEIHTLVVGGGIVGLSAAYFLSRRGARVTVIERDELAQGASSGNAGILALGHPPLPHPGLMGQMLRLLLRRTNPVYVAPRFDRSLLEWLLGFRRACAPDHFDRSMNLLARIGWPAGECVRELVEGEGIDCEYHRTGWLEVFRTREGLAEGRSIVERLEPFGYTVNVLTGDELRGREPAFRDEVAGALHYVDSGFANPGKLVSGLAARAEAHGAKLMFETEVERIDLADGRFAGVSLVDGNRLEADRLVLAAGAWSTELARAVGIRVPMQAGKGYHLNLEGVPRLPSTTCVLSENFVAVTPLDGGLRLAGTVELAGVNLRKTQRRMDMLSTGARAYIRGIDQATVETTWCGLRPMTADGLPAVGWAPGVDGVFIATGHAMMGFLLGPLSGKLASESLLDGKPSINIAALDPARFGGRS